MNLFTGIARCNVGDGVSCSFWYDVWQDGPPLSFMMPRLFSFVLSPNSFVKQSLSAPLEDNFYLPLSQEALQEFQHMFFQCPFSISYWNSLGISWNSTLSFKKKILYSKLQLLEYYVLHVKPMNAHPTPPEH
uniref:Reverse transcriptase zinc-binding domain-containing protein n=1 Tax=Oryza barthii TaxID=65489 RepID=A0A0D3F9H3_9ORYZ